MSRRSTDGVRCDSAADVEVTAKALWTAVNALRDRASAARWAAEHPQTSASRNPEALRESAENDEAMAEVLRAQAQRIEQAPARVLRLAPGGHLAQ
jgi:hypothetical protein